MLHKISFFIFLIMKIKPLISKPNLAFVNTSFLSLNYPLLQYEPVDNKLLFVRRSLKALFGANV